MVLRPLRIKADILCERHDRGTETGVTHARGFLEGRQYEEVKCYKSRGRVAGQGEYEPGGWVAGNSFERDGGEGGRLARFHGYAAKVDSSAEGALDGGFEQVKLAHGDAACGYDDVDSTHGVAEGVFESAWSVKKGEI